MKLIALIAAAIGCLGLAACSSDDPGLLPGDDADQILSNLERVEQLATTGACDSALESIETISSQIDSLPNSVSSRLRQNLKRGVSRLRQVTAASCGTATETATETETTPEETETVPEGETRPEGGATGGTGSTGPAGPANNGNQGENRGEEGNRGGGNRGGGNTGGEGGGNPTPPEEGGGNTTSPETTQPDSGGISPSVPAPPGSEETP